MQQKILQKIYETCPELKEPRECSCPSKEDTLEEPQLNHLLRTIHETKRSVPEIMIDSYGIIRYTNNLKKSENKTKFYDLTKTVSENLENEELANFIGEILFK
jgi:hypothetical protein